MSKPHKHPNAGWLHMVNRKVIVIAAGSAIAVGGLIGVQAFAGSKTFAHMKQFSSDSGGWHKAGWGHNRKTRLEDMTNAQIEAKIERMVKHVAIEIDATTEQQEKITALVVAVAKDLKPVRSQMHAAAEQIHDLLVDDEINRAALEKVRAERLAEAERISKDLINAVADVAEVLSPEQRKVLSERITEFRGKRKGWHRG